MLSTHKKACRWLPVSLSSWPENLEQVMTEVTTQVTVNSWHETWSNEYIYIICIYIYMTEQWTGPERRRGNNFQTDLTRTRKPGAIDDWRKAHTQVTTAWQVQLMTWNLEQCIWLNRTVNWTSQERRLITTRHFEHMVLVSRRGPVGDTSGMTARRSGHWVVDGKTGATDDINDWFKESITSCTDCDKCFVL